MLKCVVEMPLRKGDIEAAVSSGEQEQSLLGGECSRCNDLEWGGATQNVREIEIRPAWLDGQR